MKKIKPSELAEDLRIIADALEKWGDDEYTVLNGSPRLLATSAGNTQIIVNALVTKKNETS